MNIRLIIFDLDGTLVDTAGDITNSLNYAVEPYNIKKLAAGETVAMVGEGLTRLVEKVLGTGRARELPDVMTRFINYYSEHLVDLSRPYPGVHETLNQLGQYSKAVVSNKREALSRRLLDELNLSRYFDMVLGSDSAGEKKPSPKPLLMAMERLSMRPDQTVIVGDSNYDIEAGRAAGISTIAVSYGYREASVLKDADVIIDKFEKLEETLKNLNRGLK